MRKLASIQRIANLQQIEGADAIEVASVLGWKVVVKKGEFKVNDLCVYVEIDSLLPERPEFEFLKDSKGNMQHIKTRKMRGQISQGICFPLSIMPNYSGKNTDYREDADVTEVLGVRKWEKWEERTPKAKNGPKTYAVPRWIPKQILDFVNARFKFKLKYKKLFDIWNYIPKTDETRVQVLGKLLHQYEGERCYITEKIDGSSITMYLKDGHFGVCSRNIDLDKVASGNAFWNCAYKYNIEKEMRDIVDFGILKNFAIQGELVSSNIQGNKYQLPAGESRLYVFNIWDIDKQEYLPLNQMLDLVDAIKLKTVPLISTDFKLINDIPALVEMATKKSTVLPHVWQEGYVIRLVDGRQGRDRVSFKVINPEFLLKFGE